MRILIPYDGSQNAENALRELAEAGLPNDKHEVLAVVSDVWLPETAKEFERVQAARRLKVERSGMCSYIPARRKLEEERLLISEARERLASMFPSWEVRIETLPGRSLVSSEILQRADAWGAELMILGSLRWFNLTAYQTLCKMRVWENMTWSLSQTPLRKS